MRHTLRSSLAAASLIGLAWLSGCGGGGGGDAPAPAAPTTTSVTLKAQALDGSPLAGVDVRASSGATAQTDAQGQATLTVPQAQDVTLAFAKTDLANQVKVVNIPAGSSSATLDVTLIARQAAVTLADISVGGTASGQDGVRAEFPAGSLVNAAGQVVSGAVQVQMTPVNVVAQTAAFPGRFAGIQGNAPPVAIVSFGTAEFVPMQNGQKLQVAPGQSVVIEIPMYADKNTDGSAVQLGQVIPLWSLNEVTGVWLQEGTGTVVANPSSPTGLALRASVTHFTWWNCDDFDGPGAVIKVKCMFLDAAGNPTVPMADGQTCLVRAEVPDNRRRPATLASEIIGPSGSGELRIPAETVVELTAVNVDLAVRKTGFVSLNLPRGSAPQAVVIGLVAPVAVAIQQPAADSTLPALANAVVSVAEAVDRVDLFIGGVKVAEDSSAPFEPSFSTAGLPEGYVQMRARAVRGGLPVGVSDARNVVIDRTAPVVTLTRLNATAGNGQVELLAQVSDLSAITKVEFFRGNTLIGQSTVFPYTFTYTLQPGDTPSVDFSAQARDAGGNLGTSNVISFGTLAPTVSLARSPTNNIITASLTLTFTATAASRNGNGINRVEFFKGSVKLGEDSTEPYQQDYTVTGADEPALSVMAKAIDNAGNAATASLSVPVNISSGDAVPPSVALDTIASPVTTGALELAATASDNVAVAKVEFYVNGVFQGERTALSAGKYRQPVDVSLLGGLTTFEARAFDAAGNTASSTQTATVNIVAALLAGPGDQLVHNGLGPFCPPSMAFTADGTPYVAHVVAEASTGLMDVQVSRRVGGVWQSLGKVNDVATSSLQNFPCVTIAMAAGDVPYVAFNAMLPRTGSGQMHQLVRRLNGAAWETTRDILASNGNDLIQVVGDNAGRPVIVWSGIVAGVTKLNVERFNGTDWEPRAAGFGSLGGGGVGQFHVALRPNNDVVVANFTGTGPFSSALLATVVGGGGASTLGDATTRIIDQVGDTSQSVQILGVAADATEIAVTWRKASSGARLTRTARFNVAGNRWDLAGSEADQMPNGPHAALAFQGGTLVQVLSRVNSEPTQARRFDGTRWSAFTSLLPVQSTETRTVVREDQLFIVYTHDTICCSGSGAGVARLNLP